MISAMCSCCGLRFIRSSLDEDGRCVKCVHEDEKVPNAPFATDQPRYDWHATIGLAVLCVAFLAGMVNALIGANDERRRAESWRDLAIEMAENPTDETAKAIIEAARRER